VSTLRRLDTKNNKNIVELPLSPEARSRTTETVPVVDEHAQAANNLAPSKPIVGFDAALKRAFDFFVGGIALLVLMPFFIMLSIIIKLDSTGPALFYQQRRGRNKELINVYKFRTMHQNFSTPEPTADSFIQTKKNDPRITRLGAFLRRTSIDELPQLLNVIQGSMSLVGPRPHPAPLDEQFKHFIPGLDSRYAVKPGLTGWAQVHGLRGETVRVEDMIARVDHDCHYINNWTLWLDIKIIAATAVMGWTHRNAY